MHEELNVLKSIYLDELTVDLGPPVTVSITIYSDGNENEIEREKRLLFITFHAELPSTYPEENSPKFTLSRSRGLTDDDLNDLQSALQQTLDIHRGSSVLYECIELIRSKLSLYELPRELCAICLTSIENRHEVIRTNCDHFYHRTCLASYVRMKRIELEEQYLEAKKNGFRIEKDFRQDVEDPVCRQLLSSFIIDQLPEDVDLPVENAEVENRHLIENLPPSIRLWQERTHALFEQQKEKGGIIAPERNQELIFS